MYDVALTKRTLRRIHVAMQTDPLLNEIRDFLAQTGMSPSYFGWIAAKNTRLVDRLEQGRPIFTTTERKVRAFLADRLRSSEAA